MSVMDLMRRRCSVRKFEPRAVEREKLEQVLEAARVAPTGCNRQPFSFVVVSNPEKRKRISDRWGALAPVIIVALGDHSQSWRRAKDGKDICDIDVAIAVDHMTLMAEELGLGTCWVCSFDPAACVEVLGLSENMEPIALLPIGYPAEHSAPDRHATQRKPLEALVAWEE